MPPTTMKRTSPRTSSEISSAKPRMYARNQVDGVLDGLEALRGRLLQHDPNQSQIDAVRIIRAGRRRGRVTIFQDQFVGDCAFRRLTIDHPRTLSDSQRFGASTWRFGHMYGDARRAPTDSMAAATFRAMPSTSSPAGGGLEVTRRSRWERACAPRPRRTSDWRDGIELHPVTRSDTLRGLPTSLAGAPLG